MYIYICMCMLLRIIHIYNNNNNAAAVRRTNTIRATHAFTHTNTYTGHTFACPTLSSHTMGDRGRVKRRRLRIGAAALQATLPALAQPSRHAEAGRGDDNFVRIWRWPAGRRKNISNWFHARVVGRSLGMCASRPTYATDARAYDAIDRKQQWLIIPEEPRNR